MSLSAIVKFLTCAALAGCGACGDDREWISGEVRLAVDVDPKTFATLEIRGFGTLGPNETDTLPAFFDSIPITTSRFPYQYAVPGERSVGNPVFMHAWLAHDPTAPAASRGEPYGKAIAELCECATHTPAYADDVNISLDMVIE